MPSTLGYWAASIAEGLCDAIESLAAARALADRSPLGGAAGFGVNLPLDRAGVAQDLGFAEVAVNPLASQSSRGIVEAQILSACWHAAAVVRRFAWDVSLFTMSELAFVKLDDALTIPFIPLETRVRLLNKLEDVSHRLNAKFEKEKAPEDAISPERTRELFWNDLRFVSAINVLGLPGAVVPVALHEGHPIGVQLIAGRYREDLALDAAAAIEKRAGPLVPRLWEKMG